MANTLAPGYYWLHSVQKKRGNGQLYWPFEEFRQSLPKGVLNLRKVTGHHDRSPRYEWLLIEITKPLEWTAQASAGATKPTPANRNTRESDTIQRPDLPRDVVDRLADIATDESPTMMGGLGLLFLLFVLSLRKGN